MASEMRSLMQVCLIPSLGRLAACAAVALALLATALPHAAMAQQSLRIAAVVNNDIVTEFDVIVRLQLIIRTSGLPADQETQQRLAPQILRQLIDERLQEQEAVRLGIQVEESELAAGLAELESNNNIPAGQLQTAIESIGVPYSALLDRINAELRWQKLQALRLAPTVEISEDEIDEVLGRIAANQGSTRYRVAEIFLAVDNPADEEDVRATANGLLQELGRGASFQALARQFSQSATAAVGGDLGFVFAGELEPAIDDVLSTLSVGEVSSPIRGVSGYTIIALVEREALTGPSPGDVTVAYREIALPLSPDMSPAERKSQIDLAQTVAELATGCDDFAVIAEELGLGLGDQVTNRPVSSLTEAQRSLFETLSIDQPSTPIQADDSVRVYVVCDRNAPQGALPARDEIRDDLFREKLELLSQRLLRDLRQTAFIDIRV